MRSELEKALEENQKLKKIFNPDWLVEAMAKAASMMTMKECPNTLHGTQYKSASNYVCMQRQPQLACGADGMLESNITCYYCKDTGHIEDKCV